MSLIVTVNILPDGNAEYDHDIFYQYDYGQKLEIHGLGVPDGTQFHFANKNMAAQIVISSRQNDITIVDVPQSVLLRSGELKVYVFETTENSGKTILQLIFNVRAKEKPGDFAPPDEPGIIEQLQAKLDKIIETGIAEYEPDPALVEQLVDSYIGDNFITNNDGATVPGTAWDAVRGKAARDDITSLQQDKISKTEKGSVNGVATLGGDGKVPQVQLPSSSPTDTKDYTVSFSDATGDVDIVSGEKHSTLFGKIKKSIQTLRDALTNRINKSDIVQTTAVSDTTKIPSAGVTNGLQLNINSINDKIAWMDVVTTYSGTFYGHTGSYIKKNGMVCDGFLSIMNTNSAAANTWHQVCTLSISPLKTVSLIIIDEGNGQYKGFANINTSGVVSFYLTSNLAIGSAASIKFTFAV